MSEDGSRIDVKHEEASPAPREGWGPIATLRDEIDRLFDDFGAGLWRPLSRRMHEAGHGTGKAGPERWVSAPAMEVADCDGEYTITVELPGMTPEEVDIRLTDGLMTIRGEKVEERRDEKENYLLSERRYGAFARTLALPAGIDADAISASYKDGVLTVRMPKTAEAREKERRIEVTAA